MTRVYGRVQVQNTQVPLQGTIEFEPKQIAYIVENVMYANFSYKQTLTETGGFALDVLPGEYYVLLDGARLEIEVPPLSEVTLRELLKTKYPR